MVGMYREKKTNRTEEYIKVRDSKHCNQLIMQVTKRMVQVHLYFSACFLCEQHLLCLIGNQLWAWNDDTNASPHCGGSGCRWVGGC